MAPATVYSVDRWGDGNSDVDQQRQYWAEAEGLVRLVAQELTVGPKKGTKQELNRRGQWLVTQSWVSEQDPPQVASQTVDDPG